MALHTAAAAVVAFLIPWFHWPAPAFVYDAAQYWGGAAALVSDAGAVLAGGLTTRGASTAVVYLAPATAVRLLGEEWAPWTVLAWNSILIAIVSAILLPRMAQLLTTRPTTPPPSTRVWSCAALGATTMSGFAPFPLVDVWSLACALAGIYGLLVGRRWWILVLSGVSIGIAANLRPSLIAPLGVALLVLLLARPIRVAATLPGVVLVLLGQMLFNVRVWGLWSPVPPETGALSAVQAAPATYALRYDTVEFDGARPPQQWFCDPAYAAEVANDDRATNQLGVVISVLRHFPESIWFLVRKAAASLHWTWATPYENSPGDPASAMTVLVLLVSSGGFVAIVVHAARSRRDRGSFVTSLTILGFWGGAVAMLVLSTPETRFALPVVVIGVIGIGSVIHERLKPPFSRGAFVAAACALLLAIGLYAAGTEALSHEYPAGPLFAAQQCAAG